MLASSSVHQDALRARVVQIQRAGLIDRKRRGLVEARRIPFRLAENRLDENFFVEEIYVPGPEPDQVDRENGGQNDGEEDDPAESAPGKRWLDFAFSLYPEPPPRSEARDLEIIENWVDEVVAAFCRRHRALDHWRAAVHPPDDLFSSKT